MSGNPSPADANIDELRTALTNAKLHLDQALQAAQIGETASASALATRLRALEDQNTGCQNSGCGGAEARPGQQIAQPGQQIARRG